MLNRTDPEVSVVMSVHNGERFVGEAVRSILTQEGVDFEFVIVDDASVDTTPKLLAEFAAADARVRVIQQATNQGLTRSLIAGCAEVRGALVARIDADDVALPGRLAKQAAALRADPDATFVSCGTRFITEEGDLLYERVQDSRTAQGRLLTLDMAQLEGVSSHSSVMFRRSAYARAGGYRPQFYFAQDLDLWIRFAEMGRFIAMPEVLQVFRCRPGTLTARWRKLQIVTAQLILESARLRRQGLNQEEVLARAATVRPAPRPHRSRWDEAAALYFLGAGLSRNRNPRCQAYFFRSIKCHPLFVRAWLGFLMVRFR